MKKIKLFYNLITKCDSELQNWLEFLIRQRLSPSPLNDSLKRVLKRGNVVWVDFGINIGTEFSGKHPAIILRAYKNGESAYFLPIDSGKSNKDYCVNFERIYGYPDEDRHINAYRVYCLSTRRIDFNDKIGHISYELLDIIDEKIRKYQY